MSILSKEGKVGLVITTISLVLLGLAPTQNRRAPILGKHFRLVFHSLDGLHEGDKVAVGGVEAGRVAEIDFAARDKWEQLNPPGDERPVVLVTVGLAQGFDLGPGTAYRVESTLRGEHMINIIPPPPGSTLPAGSILRNELDYLGGDQLQFTINNFKLLNANTKMMRERFADPMFRRDMKDLASNLRFYSAEFMRLSRDSHQQMVNMTNTLDRQEQAMLEQAQRMDAKTRQVSAYVKAYGSALRGTIASYQKRLEAGQQQIDQVYKSTNEYAQTFKRYEKMLQSTPLANGKGQEAAARLHQMSNQLEDYANIAEDLHRISSDPRVKKDLKGISKRFKERSVKLKDQMHDYQRKAKVLEWIVPQRHEPELPLEKPNTSPVGEPTPQGENSP